MPNVTPFTKLGRYIACPACGKGSYAVDHLPVGTKTAWYCNHEECGREFSLHVLRNGTIDVSLTGKRCIATAVTLRCERPLTIVVRGARFQKDGEPVDLSDGQRYFYEEHTCPTNFLGVMQVMDEEGDDDPHGLFKYVKTEPYAPDIIDIGVTVLQLE